jgi:hypothetical protein
MRMCMKCWRSITEAREEDKPDNFRLINSGHYKYECNTCGKGSNGYVEVDVPEGCLMVSRGVAV